MTIEERIKYTEKLIGNSRIEGECREWTKGTQHGYGQIQFRSKTIRAHRLAYAVFKEDFDDSLCVLHICDNCRCINPDHLFLGRPADNSKDMVEKGRQAKGDRHGFILHPEKRPRGEGHGLVKHPERVARGARNGSHTHPERRARGEQNGNAKLTEEKVHEIFNLRDSGFSREDITRIMNVSKWQIQNILRGKSWKHIL